MKPTVSLKKGSCEWKKLNISGKTGQGSETCIESQPKAPTTALDQQRKRITREASPATESQLGRCVLPRIILPDPGRPFYGAAFGG